MLQLAMALSLNEAEAAAGSAPNPPSTLSRTYNSTVVSSSSNKIKANHFKY